MTQQYITLLGAEQVQRSAREISGAAERMERASGYFAESVQRLERALDEHARRVEAALSREGD